MPIYIAKAVLDAIYSEDPVNFLEELLAKVNKDIVFDVFLRNSTGWITIKWGEIERLAFIPRGKYVLVLVDDGKNKSFFYWNVMSVPMIFQKYNCGDVNPVTMLSWSFEQQDNGKSKLRCWSNWSVIPKCELLNTVEDAYYDINPTIVGLEKDLVNVFYDFHITPGLYRVKTGVPQSSHAIYYLQLIDDQRNKLKFIRPVDLLRLK